MHIYIYIHFLCRYILSCVDVHTDIDVDIDTDTDIPLTYTNNHFICYIPCTTCHACKPCGSVRYHITYHIRYIHAYVHTYIHIYIHTYIRACMHACIHTQIQHTLCMSIYTLCNICEYSQCVHGPIVNEHRYLKLRASCQYFQLQAGGDREMSSSLNAQFHTTCPTIASEQSQDEQTSTLVCFR